ncbi:MAG: hypothetical protein KY442_11615, partial [Proteobacteria bacterium]|nr:hypothetical protein [Pseudomonadota bacterium]
MIKVLVDGVVSALHRHDGSQLELLAERLSGRLAVPADHVEGVLGQHVHGAGQPAGAASAVLDVHLHVAALDHDGIGRAAQVALAVGGVLQQLPEPRQVPLGRSHVAVGLDGVQAKRAVAAGHPAVRGGARDEHVVALTDLQV